MTVDVYQKYDLPPDWQWKKLGEICSITDRDHRTPEYNESGVPLISPRDFTENGVDVSNLKRVTKTELDAFVKKCKPEKGDILYSRIGTIGEARLLNFDFEFVALHSIALVKPILKDLESKYVLYLLQTPAVREQAKHNVKSVGTPDLGLQRIKDFDVPVAPPGEQKSIVAEIEKQFSRLDEAVANLNRVKANLKRYKAAVLKAAVEGKLTEEWRKAHPDVEPASELLKRILAERRAKVDGKGNYEEPKAPDTTDLPGLPVGWTWVRLEQLGSIFGGLTKNPGREKLLKRLPYLRVANVYANELRLNDVQEIGVEDNELHKLLLESGDLLIVEGNGSKDQIGRVAIWDGSISPCVHQNHIIKVRLVDVRFSKWILFWLLSLQGRRFVEQVASSTSGLYTLSVNKVADLPLPLPPVVEQARIVAEIERRLSVTEQIDEMLMNNVLRGQQLSQTILGMAFSGNLSNDSEHTL